MLRALRQAREPVVDYDGVAWAIHDAIVWQRLVFRQQEALHRMIADDRDPQPAVDRVEHGDGKAVDYNGKEYQPINNWTVSFALTFSARFRTWDHRSSQMVDLCVAFAGIGQQSTGILYVGDGSHPCFLAWSLLEYFGDLLLVLPIGPKYPMNKASLHEVQTFGMKR